MYKTVNGWTKEMMKAQIRLKNTGTVSVNMQGCAYRGRGHNACAVGCFIPESKYRDSMDEEGYTAERLFSAYPSLLADMPLDKHGMSLMQRTHDNATGCNPILLLDRWIDENVVDSA